MVVYIEIGDESNTLFLEGPMVAWEERATPCPKNL
jgi:hypothetical protein